MKNEELDQLISRHLERLELGVPPAVQAQVRQKISAVTNRPRVAAWQRLALWTSFLAAALLIVVVSLPLLFPPRPQEKKIAQIRTEFSIPEKNIKIVWVQSQDFRLPVKSG